MLQFASQLKTKGLRHNLRHSWRLILLFSRILLLLNLSNHLLFNLTQSMRWLFHLNETRIWRTQLELGAAATVCIIIRSFSVNFPQYAVIVHGIPSIPGKLRTASTVERHLFFLKQYWNITEIGIQVNPQVWVAAWYWLNLSQWHSKNQTRSVAKEIACEFENFNF